MTSIDKLRLLLSYREAGKAYVSPTQAAPILGCMPYSLNIAAKAGNMPEGSCYFAGRNLRVSVNWLMKQAGFGEHKKSPRRRCSARPGAEKRNHPHCITTESEVQARNA